MRERHVVLAATVIVAALVVTASYYYVLAPDENSVIVTITANGGGPQWNPVVFLPDNFTVKEGEHVTVVLDNEDVYPHELQIPEFHVTTGPVQGGQNASVSFFPDTTGTFGFGQPSASCTAGPFQATCPVFGLVGNVTVLAP